VAEIAKVAVQRVVAANSDEDADAATPDAVRTPAINARSHNPGRPKICLMILAIGVHPRKCATIRDQTRKLQRLKIRQRTDRLTGKSPPTLVVLRLVH